MAMDMGRTALWLSSGLAVGDVVGLPFLGQALFHFLCFFFISFAAPRASTIVFNDN